ncbi:D-2-hydroxyacid dehydrogenase [Cytospora mali]|uniref:D-2-hydroxyacid dehydrogenase n=1 Tax=Cytospora mali TaxID=578113 RepID=A0A194WBM4_CYTMA|nr:D-2-hydroxyacid dehydrogenase [Valsa mali]
MSGLRKEKLLIFQPKGPTAEWLARVQAHHPGLEILYENSALPDGSIKPYEELKPEVRNGVTLLSTYIPPPAQFLKDVRFVQLPSAGVDKWLEHETYKNNDVVFCTGNGCHPPQIAEWVIGSWLSFQHHFARYHEQMKIGYWEPMFKSTVKDSAGARMSVDPLPLPFDNNANPQYRGILGYGAIGRQTARVASALGMEVYAYTRSPRTTPEARKDDSYCVPGTGDPDGLIPTKWFHGTSVDDINNFLDQDLDILVLSLPLTSETHGLISYEQFQILSKKKTFLSSVARGESINTDALMQALEKGQIVGAAIDGADPEPLPSDHPLWKAPNLLITPHVSWQTHRTWERVLAILEINLEKLSLGQRPINSANRVLHY